MTAPLSKTDQRIAELTAENEQLKKLAEELSNGGFAVIQRSIEDRERAESALREVGGLPDKWQAALDHWNPEMFIGADDCVDELRAILAKYQKESGNG